MPRTSLRIVVAVLLTAAAATAEKSTIAFTVAEQPPMGARLTLRSTQDSAVERSVTVTARTLISEDAGSTWEVVFISDQWWAPQLTITFPPANVTQEQPLRLWRTGIVTGTVTAGDKDLEIPKSVTLQVESPPLPSRAPEISRGTRFECPVAADGKWSCRIPATTLDLALRSTGMTPHYRWDVSVTTKQPKDLGSFVLRKGASFVGWLDRSAMKATAAKRARARLIRSVSDVPSATTARLRIPVAEAEFSERGVVQLAPLPPGTYVLEVVANGFATTRIAPVEIYEGKETAFRKVIELHRPLVVTLHVEPPTDPSGNPWPTEWRRVNDLTSGYDDAPAISRLVDESGSVTIADQSPGTFNLQIRDGRGNHVRYADFRIRDESEANISVKVDLHHVRGKITLGDDPLQAKLWFGTRHGGEKIEIETDKEGGFEGYLPRSGKWPVEVMSHDPEMQTIVDVNVPNDDKDVEIRLADTTVSGWVIGTDGNRLTRGRVVLAASLIALPVKVAEDGSFMFRAVPLGKVHLTAHDQRTGDTSRAVMLNITEGEHFQGIELRIDPSRDIKGSVVSRGQPVIGAHVRGITIEPQMKPGSKTVTDVEGRFTLQLDAASRRALIVVAAPCKTLQSFDLPIGEEPLALDIAPVGGTLELVVHDRFRVSRDGIGVPDYELFDWMMAHGEPLSESAPLRIADLAPGQYQLCSVGDKPACKSGMLTPGGSLRLELP